MRILRGFSALLLAALLGACNAIQLTYNNADTALSWMADDYLALDKPQEKMLRTRLDVLLSWHRANALPEYADAFREVKTKVAAGLKREDIVWLIDAGRSEYDGVLNRTASESVGVLSTISPEQIDNLEKKLARNNAKFNKEHLRGSLHEQREKRAKKTIERIEHWVGSLSDKQQEQITAISYAMPMTYALWRDDRIRKQQEFVAILRDKKSPLELEASLKQWLDNWQRGKSAEYRRASDAFQEQSVSLILAVDAMITPSQRAKVLAKLQSYIDDFEALAARRSQGEQAGAGQQSRAGRSDNTRLLPASG